MDIHRDDITVNGCYFDCSHEGAAVVDRPTYMPLHAYCLPEGKSTCKKRNKRPIPVFTRRNNDHLGSCRPESHDHLILRVTGQTKLLSPEGKRFQYQFQRFGFQQMCHERRQNVEIDDLRCVLSAHVKRWPKSKDCFNLDDFHFRWLNVKFMNLMTHSYLDLKHI